MFSNAAAPNTFTDHSKYIVSFDHLQCTVFDCNANVQWCIAMVSKYMLSKEQVADLRK